MKKFVLFLFVFSFLCNIKAQVAFNIVTNNCDTTLVGPMNFEYAGELDGSSSDWNCPNMYLLENAVEGCLVLANDGTTPGIIDYGGNSPHPRISDGCDSATWVQDLTGKIAVIYRGSCEFALKAYNAQKRGAIAVIIINHTGDAVGMAGGSFGDNVIIPVIMIGEDDGNNLALCLDTVCTGVIASIGTAQGVVGRIFNDLDSNCVLNSNEIGIPNRKATINPGNIMIETRQDGSWYIDSLAIGNYTITYETSSKWLTSCPSTQSFNVVNSDSITVLSNFGLIANFGIVKGNMFQDYNENCLITTGEPKLASRFGIINPSGTIIQSDINGNWTSDSLGIGSYTLTLDTSDGWNTTCNSIIPFDILPYGLIDTTYQIGYKSPPACISPYISIYSFLLRPCQHSYIRVIACNNSSTTEVMDNAYAVVELDSFLSILSTDYPYTQIGANSYQFNIGNINPGECIDFTIDSYVSCDAILGQTLCMQANLYPADSCVFDTIPTPPIGGVEPCTLPWDNSSLSVEGWCQNDSIVFSVTNTGDLGDGDMQCYSPITILVDGIVTYLDSVLLQGGETTIFSYPANGQTWILQTEQHPLHPGSSHPNAHVELCGDTANWTSGMVNIVPHNDADPIVDIYCRVTTNGYDPNDKTGYPLGIGSQHYVAPNGDIEYVIRFQNTGTDTAFTIVIRDTLDFDLDIFSVVSGASSHDYTFKMFGPRVLEWTFSNILLPDSTTDEPNSHGFVTFSVNQNPELPDFTEINNSVGIYFDFNEPVITNTTSHIVNRGIYDLTTTNTIVYEPTEQLYIYPNPAKDNLNVMLPQNNSLTLSIYSIEGKLMEQKIIRQNSNIDVSEFPNGMYFIQAKNQDGKIFTSKFIKE